MPYHIFISIHHKYYHTSLFIRLDFFYCSLNVNEQYWFFRSTLVMYNSSKFGRYPRKLCYQVKYNEDGYKWNAEQWGGCLKFIQKTKLWYTLLVYFVSFCQFCFWIWMFETFFKTASILMIIFLWAFSYYQART